MYSYIPPIAIAEDLTAPATAEAALQASAVVAHQDGHAAAEEAALEAAPGAVDEVIEGFTVTLAVPGQAEEGLRLKEEETPFKRC